MTSGAGSVTIAKNGTATGSGMALAIYENVVEAHAKKAIATGITPTAIAGYEEMAQGLADAIAQGIPWDHVIYSVDDLPTASSGYHTLTTGSWAIAAALNIGSNAIRVPSGVSVLIKGFGADKLVQGSAYDVLLVEGTASIESLNVTATSGIALDVASGGNVVARGCTWTTNSVSAAFCWGTLSDSQSLYTAIAGYGIRADGGTDIKLNQCNITSAGIAIRLSEGLCKASDCTILSTAGASAMLLDDADAQCELIGTRVECSTGSAPAINATAGSLLRLNGGSLHTVSGDLGDGITIDGAVDIVQVSHANGSQLDNFVRMTSDSEMVTLHVQGCYTSSSVSCAVKRDTGEYPWPTQGIVIAGNTFNVASPFSGFTHLSGVIFCRSNICSTGLMADTPIYAP
jgi:hypothetical protein